MYAKPCWITFQTTFTIDGDNLKEVQIGPGFETTNVRTVNGDSMVMVGVNLLYCKTSDPFWNRVFKKTHVHWRPPLMVFYYSTVGYSR